MTPKAIVRDQKGFFKDMKQERFGSPSKQESSFYCDFLKFEQQRSTKFQQRTGPETSSGGGSRHRFLEEPNHDSVFGSYGMTLCDQNGFLNKKKHERCESLSRHHHSSSHCGFLEGSTMFQQRDGPKTPDGGGSRHCFAQELSPSSIYKSHGFTLWDQNEYFHENMHKRYRSPTRQLDPSCRYSSHKFKQQGSTTLFQHVGSGGTRSGDGAKHHFLEEHNYGSGSRNMTLREYKREPFLLSRPNGITFRSTKDTGHRFLGNASTTSSRSLFKRPIDKVLSAHSHAPYVNTSSKPRHNEEQSHGGDNNNDNKKKGCGDEREDPLEWKLLSKGNRCRRLYTRGTENGGGRFVEKKENERNQESEERSNKRPRLNWGEGLAKFEKNKSGEVGVSAVVAAANTSTFVAACSSLSGVSNKLCANVATVAGDNIVGNFGGSPGIDSQNHQQSFSLNSQRIDANTLRSLSSSIVELLESAKAISVDSSIATSNAITKLLVWKNVIAKVVEATETEIDSLENELKLLESESRDGLPCSEAAGSLMVCHSEKSSDEDVGGFDKPLQIAPSGEGSVQKMPLSINLDGMHDNRTEDDINILGTISSGDATRNGTCSEDLEGIQLTAEKCLIPCTNVQVAGGSALGGDKHSSSSMEIKDGIDAHSITNFYSSTDYTFYNTIIASNKETAERASAEFDKLSPNKCCMISNGGDHSISQSQNNALIMEKLAEKRRYARFKEKVLSCKYRAFNHIWKTDLCKRSVRKSPSTSQRNVESSLQTINKGCQKNQSSIHNLFPFPAGNHLSMVPTSDVIQYTSQLLLEPDNEVNKSKLKMLALILDRKDNMVSLFQSNNGLVEDPVAEKNERAIINPWTSEERKIFSEKFAAFGKDFRKIASFLDHKTTADCVEFYYKNHKPNCLEKGKKKKGRKSRKLGTAKTAMKTSGRKRNLKVNVDSNKNLCETPVVACGSESYRRTRSGRILLWNDQRVTDATDALAGISSKDVSSFITRSVDTVEADRDRTHLKVRPQYEEPVTPDLTRDIDDGTSDKSCRKMDSSEWTDGEKEAFLQAISSFGEDFTLIAQRVGTRSEDQCRRFFLKSQKSPRLDLISHRAEDIGTVENTVNGGKSGTNDACIVQVVSVIGDDNSSTKANEEHPLSAMKLKHDESKPVEARNLLHEFNESNEINREGNNENVNMVYEACVLNCESNMDTDGCEDVLYSSDKSSSVLEVEKGKVGDAVTKLVSASEVIEPCHSHSVAEEKMVSEKLEGLPTCFKDGDGKQENDTDVAVELKNQSQGPNTSSASVGVSCSRLPLATENQPQLLLKKSNYSDNPLTNAKTMLQNIADVVVQQENLTSNPDEFQNPGITLDHDEAAGILLSYPLKESVIKQVNADIRCSSSATELPLLSQKIEQTEDHHKALLSDSEKIPTKSVVFKLFGKIITVSSPTKKPDFTAKGSKENGTHHSGY